MSTRYKIRVLGNLILARLVNAEVSDGGIIKPATTNLRDDDRLEVLDVGPTCPHDVDPGDIIAARSVLPIPDQIVGDGEHYCFVSPEHLLCVLEPVEPADEARIIPAA